MRINRGFLYLGVFLVAVGGVVVASNLGAVDTATLTDALRLWPIAVVAIGLGLVLRRTEFSLSGGLLAAALPGLVLGGAFAVAPRFAGDCGARVAPANVTTLQGTFTAPASIAVATGCGSLNVSTQAGSNWQLTAGNTAGRAPSVKSSPQSLSIESIGDQGWGVLDDGRDTWSLSLPTSQLDELSLVSNVGRSRVALAGARIGQLRLTANAAEIVVDASGASMTNLSGAIHLGRLAIQLPATGDLAGSVRVDAGLLEICAPPSVGLHVIFTGTAREVTVEGLRQSGPEWQSPNYASSASKADLQVRVDLGAVEINPIGGCK